MRSMRFRSFCVAALLTTLPTVARADIHTAAVWFDLPNCTGYGWVEYILPAGPTYRTKWTMSDGSQTAAIYDSCSNAGGCWRAQYFFPDPPWEVAKHEILWNYIGDEPDPATIPTYLGGGCGE
jgi:hypothetical protein